MKMNDLSAKKPSIHVRGMKKKNDKGDRVITKNDLFKLAGLTVSVKVVDVAKKREAIEDCAVSQEKE